MITGLLNPPRKSGESGPAAWDEASDWDRARRERSARTDPRAAAAQRERYVKRIAARVDRWIRNNPLKFPSDMPGHVRHKYDVLAELKRRADAG